VPPKGFEPSWSLRSPDYIQHHVAVTTSLEACWLDHVFAISDGERMASTDPVSGFLGVVSERGSPIQFPPPIRLNSPMGFHLESPGPHRSASETSASASASASIKWYPRVDSNHRLPGYIQHHVAVTTSLEACWPDHVFAISGGERMASTDPLAGFLGVVSERGSPIQFPPPIRLNSPMRSLSQEPGTLTN